MNILACCLFAALRLSVPDLPPGGFADTEVSTNIPITVSFRRMNHLVFTLDANPTPSNSLEVAIGRDADHDGKLAVEEEDFAFGADCGRWFWRSTGAKRIEPAPDGRFVLNTSRNELFEGTNLVKVTRRGLVPSCGTVALKSELRGLYLFVR